MAGERPAGAMKQFQTRYWKGIRTEKSKTLDEYCALTGYHRKYAISLLNNVYDEQSTGERRHPHERTPTTGRSGVLSPVR